MREPSQSWNVHLGLVPLHALSRHLKTGQSLRIIEIRTFIASQSPHRPVQFKSLDSCTKSVIKQAARAKPQLLPAVSYNAAPPQAHLLGVKTTLFVVLKGAISITVAIIVAAGTVMLTGQYLWRSTNVK